MLRGERMAAIQKLRCGNDQWDERLLRAVHVGRGEIVWRIAATHLKSAKSLERPSFGFEIQPPSTAHFSRFGGFARL
jgi:hypothetical protein